MTDYYVVITRNGVEDQHDYRFPSSLWANPKKAAQEYAEGKKGNGVVASVFTTTQYEKRGDSNDTGNVPAQPGKARKRGRKKSTP